MAQRVELLPMIEDGRGKASVDHRMILVPEH
jgi:hypothetical protein